MLLQSASVEIPKLDCQVTSIYPNSLDSGNAHRLLLLMYITICLSILWTYKPYED